jgi:hypothetical protein
MNGWWFEASSYLGWIEIETKTKVIEASTSFWQGAKPVHARKHQLYFAREITPNPRIQHRPRAWDESRTAIVQLCSNSYGRHIVAVTQLKRRLFSTDILALPKSRRSGALLPHGYCCSLKHRLKKNRKK